jgi:hypothetical protein
MIKRRRPSLTDSEQAGGGGGLSGSRIPCHRVRTPRGPDTGRRKHGW